MKIKSYVREYSVSFFENFEESLKPFAGSVDFFSLIDENVYRIYKKEIEHTLNPEKLIIIEAIETNKSFEKVGEIILKLLELNCRKNSQLVVIGGGILQDIGGFIASILYRGITWHLVPTTLLAQCDSCIGSKTSMNIANYKNQLGTFYPPTQINITTSVLGTLKKTDIASGVCEALKLAMIDGSESFERMSKSLKGSIHYKDLVSQCLEIKKTYIEQDEMDKGIRNLLNYGHTFGHAFESASDYEIPHGIAVGIGMIAANYFSYKAHMQDEMSYELVKKEMLPWVNSFLSTAKELKIETLMKSIKTDKKNSNDKIGFILTRGPGKMSREFLDYSVTKDYLSSFIAEI